MPNAHSQHGAAGAQAAAVRLYDAIMGQLEPDLTTAELPNLDRKYAGEPRAGRAARMERYRRAFARYDAELKDLALHLASEDREMRAQGRKRAAKQAGAADAKELKALEEAMES